MLVTIVPREDATPDKPCLGTGTRVIDSGTGNEIHGIVAIDVKFRIDDAVKADIELQCHLLRTNAAAEFSMIDPGTGERKRVKRIEFADGSSFSDDTLDP